jgi:phosphate transport system protein
MRVRFHQSLGDLKEKLLVMAGMAEQSIERAIEAYRTGNTTLCAQVDRTEIEINRYEREIDQMALDLLAMEQPMAIDLRFILAVIKIIVDRVREMQAFSSADLPVDIPRMAALATDMVRKALQAFIDADADSAQKVLALDDAVDKLNHSSYFALLNVMRDQPHLTPQALNALVIARSIERVADHATNIAEDVIFWVRGADVRHYLAPEADATAGDEASGFSAGDEQSPQA